LTRQNQFKKEERLKSPVEIDNLFKNCRYILCYPVKLIYTVEKNTDPHPVQVVITVPSRKFKKAVDRNFIRRKMREIYRLSKHRINAEIGEGLKIRLGIIYTGDDPSPDYSVLETALQQSISKLVNFIRKFRAN